MLGKQAFSYFAHWKALTLRKQYYLKSNLKDAVFSLYRTKTRSAFDLWRRNSASVKQEGQVLVIQAIRSEITELDQRQRKVDRQICSKETEKNARIQKKQLSIVNRLIRRFKRNALHLWKLRVEQTSYQG